MVESDIEKTGQFSIKVRVGNAEIEVSVPEKDFVLNESRHLIEQFRLNADAPRSSEVEIIQGEVAAIPEKHDRLLLLNRTVPLPEWRMLLEGFPNMCYTVRESLFGCRRQ